MMTTVPTLAELFEVNDATWPAAVVHRRGAWLLREGQGGGRRVSSATARGPIGEGDVDEAEALHHELGQKCQFMIRPGDEALDAMLAARGYRIEDEVVLMVASLHDFPVPERLRAFAHWPPLAILREVWPEVGIDVARQQVMSRVTAPRAALMSRSGHGPDRVTGAGFVGVSGRVAMAHGLGVLPQWRRDRSAWNMMAEAGAWAREQGADTIALVVLADNRAACTLYASMGFQTVGRYHYRSV